LRQSASNDLVSGNIFVALVAAIIASMIAVTGVDYSTGTTFNTTALVIIATLAALYATWWQRYVASRSRTTHVVFFALHKFITYNKEYGSTCWSTVVPTPRSSVPATIFRYLSDFWGAAPAGL
jgi:hypothetical protein